MDEPPSPHNDSYLTSYQSHIFQTRSHVAGIDGTLPQPSLIPPTAHWSSAEKNAFFHGLCVHSRLRPDLIAACIQSKTTVDVCVYLDLLEEAAEAVNIADTRAEGEIAMEVSDEWIEHEERSAAKLVDVEAAWEENATITQRQQEIERKKLSLRASRGYPKPTGERDREGERQRKAELKEWTTEQQQRWHKEDLLRSLDLKALKTLDAIMRAEEEKAEEERVAKALEKKDVDTKVVDANAVLVASRELSIPPPPLATDSSTVPPDLTPRTRLRIQKRLHMRRKRAEKAGIAASKDLTRLKVGRKYKENSKKGKTLPVIEEVVRMDMDVLPDTGPTAPESKLVHFSKLHRRFIEHGINVQSLQEDNLGILHLSTLGKLMNIYKVVHDSDADTSPTNTAINYDVVKLLADHLVRFISEVVGRAIVLKEQEVRLKEHTKIWKFAKDQVVRANVESVLEIVGARKLERRTYFRVLRKQLEEKIGRKGERRGKEKEVDDEVHSNENSNGGSDGEVESESDDGEDDGDGDDAETEDDAAPEGLPSNALHQDLYAPFIRLPPQRHVSPSYQSCPSSGAQSHHMDASEDDEAYEALIAELDEEAELDGQDCELETAYEKESWEDSGVLGEDADEDELGDGQGRGIGHTMRFRKPSSKGPIKSHVYIEESD